MGFNGVGVGCCHGGAVDGGFHGVVGVLTWWWGGHWAL